jgi:uncharacterized membrane protein
MKLVKKTESNKIYQRRDERFAVETLSGKAVNGEEKAKILLAEGLIKVTAPKPAEPEAAAEEAPAEESESNEEA